MRSRFRSALVRTAKILALAIVVLTGAGAGTLISYTIVYFAGGDVTEMRTILGGGLIGGLVGGIAAYRLNPWNG